MSIKYCLFLYIEDATFTLIDPVLTPAYISDKKCCAKLYKHVLNIREGWHRLSVSRQKYNSLR